MGNLSVGGTGKTPMIEYLIELLKEDFKLATLSRGYKRKSEGFQLANNKSSSESIGDEPVQFYAKYKKDIQVAVDINRVHGINCLKSLENAPEVILLDDAFQHRKVKAGFNILLTTYDHLYVNDFLLPAGDLRESKHGAQRADIIVVTKCPLELNEEEKAVLEIITKATKIDLLALKTQSGLSNKKWDKTIKGLTKKEVAKVSKTDDGLFVEIV